MPEDITILHLCTTNNSRDVCFLMYRAEYITTEFFVILAYFLPFYPTNNSENKNFEKMKKAPGDMIIYTSAP